MIGSIFGAVISILVVTFGMGILFSIAGVVLGHVAQRREPQGRGFWLTGLIVGYAGILIAIVVWIGWFAFFDSLSGYGSYGGGDYSGT